MLIGLRQRNLDKLEDLFWAVSTPGSKEYRNVPSISSPIHEINFLARCCARIASYRLWIQSVNDRSPIDTCHMLFQGHMLIFRTHNNSMDSSFPSRTSTLSSHPTPKKSRPSSRGSLLTVSSRLKFRILVMPLLFAQRLPLLRISSTLPSTSGSMKGLARSLSASLALGVLTRLCRP